MLKRRWESHKLKLLSAPHGGFKGLPLKLIVLRLTFIERYLLGSRHIFENKLVNVPKSGLAIGFSCQQRNKIV